MTARVFFLAILVYCKVCADCDAEQWQVDLRSVATLQGTAGFDINEMSGVAFVSIAEGLGLARFVAIQDGGGQAVEFDVALDADGHLTAAAVDSTISLSIASDFEAVAYTSLDRNSIYVADETTSQIREFGLDGGIQNGVHDLPAIFATSRGNRGLESLTVTMDGQELWTATEEALAIDGPMATAELGTEVRLLQLAVSNDTLTPMAQFVYEVDPLHGQASAAAATRSGLVDLVSLPDGGLLSLERSLALDTDALGLPSFENRIYQVNKNGATDVSGAAYDGGLPGTEYVAVGKTLLWSGHVGSQLGQNLEGLALGPQLGGGRWSLLGVVDNGDPISQNTLVTFELSHAQQFAGDFNGNGAVEQGDLDLVLLHWGTTPSTLPDAWTGTPPVGQIDQQELDAVLLAWGASNSLAFGAGVAEPSNIWVKSILASVLIAWVSRPRKGQVGHFLLG